MDTTDYNKKFEKAKKRVEDIKKFYKHLTFYVVINGFFIARRIYKDIEYGDSLIEAFTDIHNYRLFFWWGIGLVLHGMFTFKFDFGFGKDWENRKINEFMDKERDGFPKEK